MAQKGSTQATKLYRRGESTTWYFKYTNGSGKRVQRSTGTSDRREALRFQKRFLTLAGRNRAVNTTDKNLREIARLFLDPDTNPRRREALVAKKSYGLDHARNVARHTSYLIDICDKRLPGILDRPVAELGRRDVKDIAEAIVAERGSCRTSQQVFQACKTILAQAASDDLVLVSPGSGISNIQYKEKQKISIHEQDIVWLLDHKDIFPSREFWAFIKVLATTGMRRGEAIAVSTTRINGGMLTVDRQVKANSQVLTPPKWGLVRTIPLAQVTLHALSSLTPDTEGFYFPLTRNWVTDQLRLLKASLKAAFPDRWDMWSKLTPHVLRRSLNTNLLLHGCPSLLVAEYMSWHHQRQDIDQTLPMQMLYFEAVSTDLLPVADAIDALFS